MEIIAKDDKDPTLLNSLLPLEGNLSSIDPQAIAFAVAFATFASLADT
jgi:hypothetical protein